MRSPYVVTHRRLASSASNKKGPSMYIVAFALLLLIVAAMSFVGMSHLQSHHAFEMNTNSVTTFIKQSEATMFSTDRKSVV